MVSGDFSALVTLMRFLWISSLLLFPCDQDLDEDGWMRHGLNHITEGDTKTLIIMNNHFNTIFLKFKIQKNPNEQDIKNLNNNKISNSVMLSPARTWGKRKNQGPWACFYLKFWYFVHLEFWHWFWPFKIWNITYHVPTFFGSSLNVMLQANASLSSPCSEVTCPGGLLMLTPCKMSKVPSQGEVLGPSRAVCHPREKQAWNPERE